MKVVLSMVRVGVVPPCVEDLVDDVRTPLAGLWTPNLDGNAGNTKLH